MAIAEKILDFGKNKGQALGACEQSYITWLAQHPMRLREDHRHFSVAAIALLEERKGKVEIPEEAFLNNFKKAADQVFYSHGDMFVVAHVGSGYYASVNGEEIACAADEATAIKKALHRTGYVQEVVAKLQASA